MKRLKIAVLFGGCSVHGQRPRSQAFRLLAVILVAANHTRSADSEFLWLLMEKTMPKGWNDLSEEAKLGYVSAEFVEKVEDVMSLAQDEIDARKDETRTMTAEEYMKFCSKIMRKYVDLV